MLSISTWFGLGGQFLLYCFPAVLSCQHISAKWRQKKNKPKAHRYLRGCSWGVQSGARVHNGGIWPKAHSITEETRTLENYTEPEAPFCYSTTQIQEMKHGRNTLIYTPLCPLSWYLLRTKHLWDLLKILLFKKKFCSSFVPLTCIYDSETMWCRVAVYVWWDAIFQNCANSLLKRPMVREIQNFYVTMDIVLCTPAVSSPFQSL